MCTLILRSDQFDGEPCGAGFDVEQMRPKKKTKNMRIFSLREDSP